MSKQTLVTTISCCLAIHVAYSSSQELLASRDNLTTSLLCAPSQRNESLVKRCAGARRRSDHKHAVCVFTGEQRTGDYEQLLFFLSGEMSLTVSLPKLGERVKHELDGVRVRDTLKRQGSVCLNNV